MSGTQPHDIQAIRLLLMLKLQLLTRLICGNFLHLLAIQSLIEIMVRGLILIDI